MVLVTSLSSVSQWDVESNAIPSGLINDDTSTVTSLSSDEISVLINMVHVKI